MLIDYEGRAYDFDLDDLTVKQALKIEKHIVRGRRHRRGRGGEGGAAGPYGQRGARRGIDRPDVRPRIVTQRVSLLRARYLITLAQWNIPPAAVNALTLTDFAQLADAIDAKAASPQQQTALGR